MSQPRVLVAGVGNIFLGDDAFGVEVVRRLAGRAQPEGVRVVDFGIRGLDLLYTLLDGCQSVILVDAVPRGGPPGTLYLLEIEGDAGEAVPESGPMIDTHDLDPAKVLRLAGAMGARVERLLLVGCEPSPLADTDDLQTGMSEAVQRAVEEAVPLVESLARRLLDGEAIGQR